MLRLHQIFLINVAIIFSALVLIMFGASYYSTKQIDISTQEKNLAKTIAIANELLQKEDSGASLDTFVQKIKKISGYRITIINDAGVVVAESDSEKGAMQNHLNRPEIMQSMRESMGKSIRHSSTIGRDFVYVCTKTSFNETPLYLRLASEVSEYEQYLYSLWYQIGFVFLGALAIAIYLSLKINKRIEAQISGISEYLSQLENKNFNAVIKPGFAREFYSIADVLMLLTKKLEKQENQKRKYTTKLKLKNKQSTDIIEAIAHEFKNPVAAVMGYTETIMNDDEMDNKIRLKFLQKVHSNAQMISKMIDRLSLSLKLENNTIEVKSEKFDLLPLITTIKEQLLQKHKKRDVIIKGSNVLVNADATLIQLAITNLMDNALKYSEENITVDLTTIKDDLVSIMVIDHGMGIAEKELDNITKKFYRIDKNGWDNSLGLGLSLVKYILKLHNTKLEISSEPAKGSVFGFSLPTNP